MAKAKIYWDRSISAYRLQLESGPKLKELVDFLKKQIPHSDRDYDSNAHVWTFAEKYLDGTVKLCGLMYGTNNVAVLNRQQVEAASSGANINVKKLDTSDSMLAEFMHLIPFESAQKAYRSACMVLHPDKGGDMEKMSRLNAIWQRIEKEVYKQ